MKIYRNYDVILKDSDLEHLYTFKNFPILMSCTHDNSNEDQFLDLSIHISKKSGVLQLNLLLPLEVIYKESHNSGKIGKTWREHHESFSAFIKSYNPNGVVEVGGGHGILAAAYGNSILWTILEPNPTPVENCKAVFVKEFFTKNTDISKFKADTLVHSHVFEHMHDPTDFVSTLQQALSIGQKVIFSVPNMQQMLKRNYTNFLNFEHTFCLTEEIVEYLMSNAGFKLLSREYFKNDNSIFYAWERLDNMPDVELPTAYEKYKSMFLNYVEYHETLIESLNNSIKSKKNVFLFGGHVFSQYLISFGLNVSNVSAILDNDPSKQNKRLYGTSLTILSPEVLKGLDKPYVILKAGSFTEEIREGILKINSSTIFL
jgi:2-polyprenyl-3-methyl-5-hydroxy-6-metoxy-1,4-benzoquinol methylase